MSTPKLIKEDQALMLLNRLGKAFENIGISIGNINAALARQHSAAAPNLTSKNVEQALNSPLGAFLKDSLSMAVSMDAVLTKQSNLQSQLIVQQQHMADLRTVLKHANDINTITLIHTQIQGAVNPAEKLAQKLDQLQGKLANTLKEYKQLHTDYENSIMEVVDTTNQQIEEIVPLKAGEKEQFAAASRATMERRPELSGSRLFISELMAIAKLTQAGASKEAKQEIHDLAKNGMLHVEERIEEITPDFKLNSATLEKEIDSLHQEIGEAQTAIADFQEKTNSFIGAAPTPRPEVTAATGKEKEATRSITPTPKPKNAGG